MEKKRAVPSKSQGTTKEGFGSSHENGLQPRGASDRGSLFTREEHDHGFTDLEPNDLEGDEIDGSNQQAPSD